MKWPYYGLFNYLERKLKKIQIRGNINVKNKSE